MRCRSRSPHSVGDRAIARSSGPAPTSTSAPIGRDLGVDVVLTGTILRAGQHVRVSAQLADAAAGTHDLVRRGAGADRRPLPAAGHADHARSSSSLKLPLSASDRSALDRQAPANADAYALYLRAQ